MELKILEESIIDDFWKEITVINSLLMEEKKEDAINVLIQLLDKLRGYKYPQIVNHYIRQLGLYPYMQEDTSLLADKLVYNLFKMPISETETRVLHKEQSLLLKKLLNNQNLAISAPTSFGKSFVIDSIIHIKKPDNIVIIVPTIALMDEIRRRLQKKISNTYNIITSSNEPIVENSKNILIFPQERALHYVDILTTIDLLVVDEFYKASRDFDKERSDDLITAIIKFKSITKQFYFLAPNISGIVFKDFETLIPSLEFLHLKTKTVFLNEHNLSEHIGKDKEKKIDTLVKLLTTDLYNQKTLVYAGSYSAINEISDVVLQKTLYKEISILQMFSKWIQKNYGQCTLVNLISNGVGIHNGQQHRPLSQLQLYLFSLTDQSGIHIIISTSSIIEGVNTSAKNVIMWSRKNGSKNLSYFDYKNLIGRSGRMFQYFIGDVYLLEAPIKEVEITLELPFSEGVQSQCFDECVDLGISNSKVEDNNKKLKKLVGLEKYRLIQTNHPHLLKDIDSTISIINAIQKNPKQWFNRLKVLNIEISSNYWKQALYDILITFRISLGVKQSDAIHLTNLALLNWKDPLCEILQKAPCPMEKFFEFEKKLTFNFSSILRDIQTIFDVLYPEKLNITSFITFVSHAFLPRNVYLLEEYGLPRMISRKIHDSKLINLEEHISLKECINKFKSIEYEKICTTSSLDEFDKFILKYFYDGI